MPTLTPMMGFRGHVSFSSEGVPFAHMIRSQGAGKLNPKLEVKLP
jgi:hypothetical protein